MGSRPGLKRLRAFQATAIRAVLMHLINRGKGGKNEDYECQNLCSGQSVEELDFLKVYADVGITGLGEATGGLATKPNLGNVKELV